MVFESTIDLHELPINNNTSLQMWFSKPCLTWMTIIQYRFYKI